MPKKLLFPLAVLLLGACRPEAAEPPPRLKPLLEALAPRYRPLDRQDTLTSYYAPDSLVADSLFHFTNAHRSQVVVRVRFVPASVARAAGLDTLHFVHANLPIEVDQRPGYRWDFFWGNNSRGTVAETADGVPLRLSVSYEWRLALTENRRWPGGNTYSRNDYLMDYPFNAVAQAQRSDSVVYVRAYLLLPNRPRPDTLYTYYHNGEHRRRIPLVADQLDTTRQALLRLSFRVLSHSAD